MATAKKLPSGSWRVRAFAGRDPVTGKQMFVSFTAPTKKEAELKAAQFAAEQKERSQICNLTVSEAIERYIIAKTAVLSPSTIRGYRVLQRTYYANIGYRKINSLMTEDMQLFISSLVGQVSAKSIANIYGLLSSSVSMFRPDAVFRVTLPKKKKSRPVSPSDRDVVTLFEAARPELQLAIALAAFGSLRRGEICALKHSDVSGLTVYVHADMVADENNVYHYKEMPKTSESVRMVRLPAEVVALIPDGIDDAFIIDVNPDALTSRFRRLRERLGVNIRFHDLRHYFASIGAVLGIPDTYMSAFGGWRPDSPVMKQTYQNQITDASQLYAQTMTDHFSKLISGS